MGVVAQKVGVGKYPFKGLAQDPDINESKCASIVLFLKNFLNRIVFLQLIILILFALLDQMLLD